MLNVSLLILWAARQIDIHTVIFAILILNAIQALHESFAYSQIRSIVMWFTEHVRLETLKAPPEVPDDLKDIVDGKK